ncbi:MAG TPA: DUF5777 family beta-barrel protein [Holophagaceae bacterium]|nr:DUF5777 family beta-barrel protein [Holophagaceae bacterium]
MTSKLATIALISLLGLPLAAQEASDAPLALNLPTADHLADWDIGLRFTHRFQEQAKSGSKDLYGLDNGAFTGFGFDFGIKAVPGLNAEIYRTSDQKTLTLALQEQVAATDHWRVALRAERYDETVKGGLVGGAFQVPVDWQPTEAFTVTLVPTFLSKTATARNVATAGLGFHWAFTEHQGVLAEFYPRPSKVANAYEQGWALGYQYRTAGHRFSLLASNELGTTAHQVLGGDYETFGPRRSGDWVLGFNLVRLF